MNQVKDEARLSAPRDPGDDGACCGRELQVESLQVVDLRAPDGQGRRPGTAVRQEPGVRDGNQRTVICFTWISVILIFSKIGTLTLVEIPIHSRFFRDRFTGRLRVFAGQCRQVPAG